ncbi:hypothetical protein MPDQ_001871 [Monascus purpureus]|uniref:Haloacid dehalogenase, type II n=1 Tax=Monascus purpureus TaxID=5098 RepID=A0A507QQE7_MONPU|nr:hypothetical protein MPDQ_001871 [Monascus purpureus]BDD62355.1 hypothetical protein MAP00_007324 [Monascus purpureus]
MPIKALLFDLMGTCCDWKSSIQPKLASIPVLSARLSDAEIVQLATDWRAGFFEEIHARFCAGAEPEDIDVTHRRVLDRLLAERGIGLEECGDGDRSALVRSWHWQLAWPDTVDAIERLRKEYMVVVLANGTTRLQMDIVKSSGIPFHSLFSSQLLGSTKPDPAIYRKALDLLQIQPDECVMVAAHAYDLRAAKEVGMRTVYVHRSTEDVDEDMDVVRRDVDLFLTADQGGKGPLEQLADLMGVLFVD